MLSPVLPGRFEEAVWAAAIRSDQEGHDRPIGDERANKNRTRMVVLVTRAVFLLDEEAETDLELPALGFVRLLRDSEFGDLVAPIDPDLELGRVLRDVARVEDSFDHE